MNPEPLSLSAHALSFSFRRGKPVVDCATFTAEPKQHIAIVGENGSGKSTLFRLLIRALSPTGGDIAVLEKSIAHYTQGELAHCIAFLPQEAEIAFPLSAWDIAMMGRSPYLSPFALPRDLDRERVEWAMRLTHCLQFAKRPIAELSGGERQRVFLARVFAQDTPILLLDEPTTHLDLHYQWHFLDWIAQLIEEKNKTVLSTLHHVEHAEKADAVWLWRDGRVLESGPPQHLLKRDHLETLFRSQRN